MFGWINRFLPSNTKFEAGDVVIDRYDGERKTVEGVSSGRAEVVWFEGSKLRRASLLTRNLIGLA